MICEGRVAVCHFTDESQEQEEDPQGIGLQVGTHGPKEAKRSTK